MLYEFIVEQGHRVLTSHFSLTFPTLFALCFLLCFNCEFNNI